MTLDGEIMMAHRAINIHSGDRREKAGVGCGESPGKGVNRICRVLAVKHRHRMLASPSFARESCVDREKKVNDAVRCAHQHPTGIRIALNQVGPRIVGQCEPGNAGKSDKFFLCILGVLCGQRLRILFQGSV